ncbi:MAG: hypothetical protein SOH81_08070 [Acetobacter sp.]|jgi:hypothetical protein
MNRFLMATLGLMIASPAMSADLTPSFPSGGINPSRGIYGGMVTGLTITEPGAYAPSDLPVKLSIDGNQSGERASASVTAYTAVSARVASAGSGCPAGSIYSYGATGTKIIVSDGNGLSGATVSVVSGGTGNSSAIPANPVSMTAAKSSCTPPKFNLSWGVQAVSLDNQGWGYASPPSGTGSVSTAPDAAIALVGTTVQTGVVSLPDKLVAASRVGAAGGVAGLDSGNNIYSPIRSSTDWLGNWQKNTVGTDSFSRGYESAVLGGNVALGGGQYAPRTLILQSDPYGPYSVGCGIGQAMTGSIYSSQMPVSQADPRNGASSVVSAAQYDVVSHCNLVGSIPARLVFSVASYTADGVYLSAPLSSSQAAQIRQNMYITTNSPDTGITLTNTAGNHNKKNLFSGFVKKQPAEGDSFISVYAWSVPGYGSSASGQIPQMTILDTTWTKYPSPTVFLGGGAGSAAFAENWFFSIDASQITPSSSNKSLVHQYTPLEIDLNIINGTAPDKSVWWQGINMSAGNQPKALTDDSRQFYMGGVINHHLIIDGGAGNWDLEANGVYIPVSGNGISSTTTTQISQIWQQWVSGVNKVGTELYTTLGNGSATTGWQQAVVHFGVTVDGTPTQTGDMGGSKQGDIQWNVSGNYGSISLCGYSISCGLRVNGDGTTKILHAATFSDVVNITSGIYAVTSSGSNLVQFYPTSAGDWTVGTSISGGGNIRGVNSLYLSGGIASSGELTLNSGTSVRVGSGLPLYLTPTTMTSGILPCMYAPDSLHIRTCSNNSSQIYFQATGDLQSLGGTSNISGWHADGHGNWSATQAVAGGGSIKAASYAMASLPTAGESDGAQLWCSDCKLNGITGVEAYWHSSASKWTDSQNNDLTTN